MDLYLKHGYYQYYSPHRKKKKNCCRPYENIIRLKMFWKESVYISEQILKNSALAMNVSRICGLFPFKIYRMKNQYYLKWSLVYTIYSFVLGAILGNLYL